MRFVNDKCVEIRDLLDWEEHGKPAAEHHWTDGRSAKELARAWMEGGAAAEVVALLSMRPELTGVRLECGIAERKTQFDNNPRGKRNHDLLVQGKTDRGTLVIGVEGKADEPFDLPLEEKALKAREENPRSKQPERIDRLTQLFFGATIEDEAQLGLIRYQLLSALAGTLADAVSCGATDSVLLIHELRSRDHTDAPKLERNARDLDSFLTRLFGHEPERIERQNGWITEPKTIQGRDEWVPPESQVFVAKLISHVS